MTPDYDVNENFGYLLFFYYFCLRDEKFPLQLGLMRALTS
jgi:hypothetical protein